MFLLCLPQPRCIVQSPRECSGRHLFEEFGAGDVKQFGDVPCCTAVKQQRVWIGAAWSAHPVATRAPFSFCRSPPSCPVERAIRIRFAVPSINVLPCSLPRSNLGCFFCFHHEPLEKYSALSRNGVLLPGKVQMANCSLFLERNRKGSFSRQHWPFAPLLLGIETKEAEKSKYFQEMR